MSSAAKLSVQALVTPRRAPTAARPIPHARSRKRSCVRMEASGVSPNMRCVDSSVSDSERGQSSANDPVTISPAGSYVPITTPVVETLLSTSFSPEGMVPSENRRLPDR
jgi:hypothetical protein